MLPLRYKSSRHAPEEQRIAAAASDLFGDDEAEWLNGGTTTTEAARALALRTSGNQLASALGAPPLPRPQ
ncbi:hypothetical protein [Streptomyces sp. NPDC055749]